MLIHPGLELSSSRFVAPSLRGPSSSGHERIYSISPTSPSGAHLQFHLPNAEILHQSLLRDRVGRY